MYLLLPTFLSFFPPGCQSPGKAKHELFPWSPSPTLQILSVAAAAAAAAAGPSFS